MVTKKTETKTRGRTLDDCYKYIHIGEHVSQLPASTEHLKSQCSSSFDLHSEVREVSGGSNLQMRSSTCIYSRRGRLELGGIGTRVWLLISYIRNKLGIFLMKIETNGKRCYIRIEII